MFNFDVLNFKCNLKRKQKNGKNNQMYFYGPISDSSNSDQITSGKFFCQKSRDPDQENTFQKSGPELYIIAKNFSRS